MYRPFLKKLHLSSPIIISVTCTTAARHAQTELRVVEYWLYNAKKEKLEKTASIEQFGSVTPETIS